MLFSRRGPLGGLNLLYTPAAMALAQALLVSPLSFGLAYQLSRQRGRESAEAARTLGAGRLQTLGLVLRELRPALAANLFVVFARAISEVGTVMIVGGNIRYQTRVLTTAIASSASMGETGFAVALGLILVALALALSAAVSFFPKRDREAAG
jgi:tungstate transport system permease protein